MRAKKKLPKWMKKLTVAQRKHLFVDSVEKGCRPTLAGFKADRIWQRKKEQEMDLPLGSFCRECRSIALALGIEQPGDEG